MSEVPEPITDRIARYAAVVDDHDAHYTREAYESHTDWHEAWNVKRSAVSRLARAEAPFLIAAGHVSSDTALAFGGFAYWAESKTTIVRRAI